MPILVTEKPLTLDQHLKRLDLLTQKDFLSPRELNKLVKSKEFLQQHAKELSVAIKAKNPLAHFKPSYLQCLKLNCWLGGSNFLLDFESNRQGKTAVSVVRLHTFFCPPIAKSPIFHPLEEENPATIECPHFFQVLPPPPIACIVNMGEDDPLHGLDPFLSHLHPSNLPIFLDGVSSSPLLAHIRNDIDDQGIYRPSSSSILHASMLPTLQENLALDAVLSNNNTVWHCSPDHKKFKAVCAKAWEKWTPPDWFHSYSEHDGIIKIKYPNGLSLDILSKSYDSNIDAFMGDAVRAILITEGPPVDKWKEIKLRFEYPALGGFDFTPAESTNSNSSCHLAEQIYKKKEEVPLSPIVFSGFGIEFAPPHVLPAKKKADMIRMYRHLPEGAARLDGKFFSSVPIALHALNREIHCLPLTLNEFVKLYYPNFESDPSIRFRGYDEGSDSPSACVWGALLPDDVWAIYRGWEQNQLTIDERCERIIALSGNERKERIVGKHSTIRASGDRNRSTDKWYEERMIGERIVMTIADYHIFKEDQVTGKTHARNYIQAGLTLRASITAGPEQRVLLLNNKLTPERLENPNNPDVPILKPRIVFLMKEPGVAEMIDKFEEWYWERYVQGPRRDEPKDKVSDKDDHLADAFSYIVLSPFRWSPSLATQGYRNQFNSKPDQKYLAELAEFFNL